MGSDNPDGADNQQERLIELGWVIGFVDGEGCFSIGFVRQPGGRGRNAYSSAIRSLSSWCRRARAAGAAGKIFGTSLAARVASTRTAGTTIAQTMNRRKARPDLVRILRGHTPEVQDT